MSEEAVVIAREWRKTLVLRSPSDEINQFVNNRKRTVNLERQPYKAHKQKGQEIDIKLIAVTISTKPNNGFFIFSIFSSHFVIYLAYTKLNLM